MAVMGVRISWLMLARNSDLARLALSAASLGVVGIVGKDIKDVPPQDFLANGLGGFGVVVADGHNREIGRQYQVKSRDGFKYLMELGRRWCADHRCFRHDVHHSGKVTSGLSR